jgi:hypothetical protein
MIRKTAGDWAFAGRARRPGRLRGRERGGPGEAFAGAADPCGCSPVTGLQAPLPVCSPSNPCTRPAPELRVPVITSSSDAPLCRTTAPGRPFFDDGPPLSWVDPSGVARYACRFGPRGAAAGSPRPLLVFLHGGGGSADGVYDATSLRAKAEGDDLAPTTGRGGFHLHSVQGRNLHYPTGAARDGRHHDFYFRDLRSPSSNPDVAHLDRLIDALVAEGEVDRRRIYLAGWSNGAFFAQMYGIARHASPTPGGQRVAAVVAFGADPFHDLNAGQQPSCRLDPYPSSPARAPGESQLRRRRVRRGRRPSRPGLRGRARARGRDLAARPPLARRKPDVSRRIVAGIGLAVPGCTPPPLCAPAVGPLNHVGRPDGVADGSGVDHEPEMLDFLPARPRTD